jgi:DNA-binding XRE family transcriptional regulator
VKSLRSPEATKTCPTIGDFRECAFADMPNSRLLAVSRQFCPEKIPAMDLKRYIAIKLRTIRKDRKLTQEELAALIGRSVDAISNIERGKGLPSLGTLEAIAVKPNSPSANFSNWREVGGGRTIKGSR